VASKPSLPLACPRCATRYSLEERFCTDCGMPLTYAGKVDVTERATGAREQARKIRPEFTRGDLRRVATARHQPEAELIQMLLLEEGIPSTLRRSAGFDVPDFLAAGPRDVMVPESGLDTAREVLRESEISASPDPRVEGYPITNRPMGQLFLGLLAGAAVLCLLVWLVVTLNS
jgi:Putative prokaryotic signal transducing protein